LPNIPGVIWPILDASFKVKTKVIRIIIAKDSITPNNNHYYVYVVLSKKSRNEAFDVRLNGFKSQANLTIRIEMTKFINHYPATVGTHLSRLATQWEYYLPNIPGVIWPTHLDSSI
jgi:hypothetical protein